MGLNPEDPRPPYLQVAHALRAAILTKTYDPGERLPSSRELSERYGVARMTVQRALQLLHDEDLIYARPGSGIYVREKAERPIGLRPHLEAAFLQRHVSIDFAGLSGETLSGAIQEPLDKVRHGLVAPDTIHVRILTPTTAAPWALPCRADDLEDDPEFRQRASTITARATSMISDAVQELTSLGLIKEGKAELRSHRLVPLFKLYIINQKDVFFGFYPIQEHTVTINDQQHPMFDLMGKDAILFHHSQTSDESSVESQYVGQARTWFDSTWNTIGRAE